MKINLNKLNKSIASALKQTAIEVAESATVAIETERWDWDRETARSDGSIAGSPRDVVDTGELRDSQAIEVSGQQATIAYTAPHAAIVHRDRPFLRTALDESDPAKIFADKLRKLL